MEIQHFSHNHPLVFIDDQQSHEGDKAYCYGCEEVIEGPRFSCVTCGFHLDEICAKALSEINHPFHSHHNLNLLQILPYASAHNELGTLDCGICHEEVNKECGSYYFSDCKFILHVNCALRSIDLYYKIESKEDYEKALVADTGDPPFFAIKDTKCGENVTNTEIIHFSHQHNLVLSEVVKDDDRYTGKYCNACGRSTDGASIYRCKGCDFNVHFGCTHLPQIARHKCDEHLLTLTYHEDNDYSKYHYCDICEEKRNLNIWFYHCAICDTSAHPKCVLGDFPFVQPGIKLISKEHPHPLVLVKKDYDYPECCKLCGKSCLDLAVECTEAKCNYVTHFKKCVE
ncbi:hypothetical protein PTKIN_Ptkin16aG0501900 [Pterospermum kingtungense]